MVNTTSKWGSCWSLYGKVNLGHVIVHERDSNIWLAFGLAKLAEDDLLILDRHWCGLCVLCNSLCSKRCFFIKSPRNFFVLGLEKGAELLLLVRPRRSTFNQNKSNPSSSEPELSSWNATLLCLRKLMIAFPSSGSGVFGVSLAANWTLFSFTD